MTMRKLCLAMLMAILLPFTLIVTTATAAEIEGHWRTENGGQVQIKPCGTTWCGYITEVSVPRHIYNKNQKLIDEVGMQNLPDVFNENPDLRARRLLGLKIFTVTGYESEKKLLGTLYNAEDGKIYEGILTVQSHRSLELSGCVFFNLICRSETWTRVP